MVYVPDPSAPSALSSLPGFPCSPPHRVPSIQHCSRALSLRPASPAQVNSACPQGPVTWVLAIRHL